MKPVVFLDNVRDAQRQRFYTPLELGEKQSATPEGFLLCQDVPLARTGIQLYDASEVPLSTVRGAIKVDRQEAEVFRPEFMASLNAKPFTNDHPPENVTPNNWQEYTVGMVMNVRRGVGIQMDLLLGDIIIYDPDAIKEIRENGKREVSCGYDADYEEIEPGLGRQFNLMGNHVALVGNARCGHRCAIGDEQTVNLEDDEMKMQARDKKPSWIDRLRAAIKANDAEGEAAALKEAEAEGKEEKTETKDELHLHIGGSNGGNTTGMETTSHDGRRMTDEDIESRFQGVEKSMKDGFEGIMKKLEGKTDDSEAEKAIEGDLKEEAPAGTGDSAMKSKDSAFLQDSMQETMSVAEILVPGMRFPTFDAAASPAKGLEQISSLRRKALELFNLSPEGRMLIEEIVGRPLVLDGMPTGTLRTLYRSVGAAARAKNNESTRRSHSHDAGREQHKAGHGGGMGGLGGVKTAADLNKRMADYYGNK